MGFNGKYLRLFKTQANFEAAYNGSGYTEPWASCVIDNEQCEYNKPFNNNGHEYVDLGLPSGTLWATCNVGGATPADGGLAFAWGEVETKDEYTMETYKYANGSSVFDNSAFTKYNPSDGLQYLLPEDDVAHVVMGGDWHMPNVAQYVELMENGSFTYKSGLFTFTSSVNGNQMKIRFNNTGRIWLADLNTGGCKWAQVAEWLGGGSNRYLGTARYYGYSVRGVIGNIFQ